MIDGKVVRWAANEAEHQNSGALSVVWLIDGWYFLWPNRAEYWNEVGGPTIKEIQILGSLVEPRTNVVDSFRTTNVLVGERFSKTTPWREIPRQMELLVAAWPDLESDVWYEEFEKIHPFADGNGRVGSLLWNAHRGSLENLEVPPDFWK